MSRADLTLDEWMREGGVKNERLAAQLDVHPITISRWRTHTQTPRPLWMARIAAATDGKVQPNAWFRPAPRRRDARTSPPGGADTPLEGLR